MRIERRGAVAMGLFSFLSVWLGPAKAKAPSMGSMAEFRNVIMTALQRRHLAERVTADPTDPAKFTMMAHGESSAVDRTNIYGYINAYPEQNASQLIDRFIGSITEDHNKPVEDESIVAVIRTRDYVDAMPQGILHEPLGADLVILYMADRPDSMAPINKANLPGGDLTSIRKIALDNIHKWLPKVVADDGLGDGVLYYVEENTMLSTSLVLLEDFWKLVAARFPGDVLIAIPRKDQLFLFDDNAKTRAGIRRLIDVTIEENVNLLSPHLYARRGGKIVAVAD